MKPLILFLILLPLMVLAGCSGPKDIAFQTEHITYSGDLEEIAATPRIGAIRSKDSPYIDIIHDLLKIDLKPFTERGTLLVYSESRTVTRIQEQQDDSSPKCDRCPESPSPPSFNP
jgi:hypothetical protein